MKIVFVRDYVDKNGIQYRPGAVLDCPDEIAQRLVLLRVANVRKEVREPEETKQDESGWDPAELGEPPPEKRGRK